MGAGNHVGDDFRVGRIRHGRFQDANNGGGAGVEANVFADDGGIAVQHRGPETIGEYDGAGGVRILRTATGAVR